MQLTPQTKVRVLFYLVFTMFGLFHAEVLSRSQPWVLVNPLMFMLVAPVYGVHYVVLGDLLLRRKATGFFPVFLAGCILGMYEFAITKVFWTPPWAPFAPRLLETAWMEVLWVGFFWHAFMSFAVPFFLVRKLVLERHPNPFRIREVRYILVGVPLISATFGIGFGTPPLELFASIFLSMVGLLAICHVFRREAPGWGFKGVEDVLLSPGGRRVGLGMLVAVYAFFGVTMRTEALPSPVGVVIPALAYAALFILLYPFVRKAVVPIVVDGPAPAPTALEGPAPAVSKGILADPLNRFFAVYALCFVQTVISIMLLAVLAPWALFILTIVIILTGGGGATLLLIIAVRSSARAWRARPAPPAPA